MKGGFEVDVIAISKFVTPTCCIEFHPVSGMPGHSHKVVIDGKPQEGLWLPADEKPNKKNAIFFVRVFAALKAGLPKYPLRGPARGPAGADR